MPNNASEAGFSAVRSATSASMERWFRIDRSRSNMWPPRVPPTMRCIAAPTSAEPKTRPLPSVPMRMAPPVPTWYCFTASPASQTALPAAETEVKTGRAFIDASMSPMRPPQPRVAPSGAIACQVFCWSLCEKRLAGFGCEPSAYCALVVGMTSGPTFGTIASRLSLLTSCCRLPISGCNAKLRPCALAGTIGSTPPSRAGEPAAAPALAGVPGASSAIESGAWLRTVL